MGRTLEKLGLDIINFFSLIGLKVKFESTSQIPHFILPPNKFLQTRSNLHKITYSKNKKAVFRFWYIPIFFPDFCICEEQLLRFTQVPTEHNEYSNERGIVLTCKGEGTPEPIISWINADGSPTTVIEGLRRIQSNSLIIEPFSSNLFRSDVHSTGYRCLATSANGKLVSVEIVVQAGNYFLLNSIKCK